MTPTRGAGGGAVNAHQVVHVIANARLERAHIVHRQGLVRPDGVVDVERELVVQLARAGGNLEHAATIRPAGNSR